ncbi:MAG: methyltransferase domain-containing protein [Candidatus Latescibacterota bacterium]|nr:methyltransferase domain-containing protein [Candidatus Latescibacterota bacterium]
MNGQGLNSASLLVREGAGSGDRYTGIARFYDALAKLYSGGAIRASLKWAESWLEPGERALFVGCGSAFDAATAAARGVCCTIVDSSPAMLERACHRSWPNANPPAVFCCDVRQLPYENPFDSVVAGYFLNVFNASDLRETLRVLQRLLRPEGRLVIADFAPVSRSARWFHDVPMQLFHQVTGSAIHPPHDYAAALGELGGAIEARQAFRVYRCGPAWFEGLMGRMPAVSDP